MAKNYDEFEQFLCSRVEKAADDFRNSSNNKRMKIGHLSELMVSASLLKEWLEIDNEPSYDDDKEEYGDAEKRSKKVEY